MVRGCPETQTQTTQDVIPKEPTLYHTINPVTATVKTACWRWTLQKAGFDQKQASSLWHARTFFRDEEKRNIECCEGMTILAINDNQTTCYGNMQASKFCLITDITAGSLSIIKRPYSLINCTAGAQRKTLVTVQRGFAVRHQNEASRCWYISISFCVYWTVSKMNSTWRYFTSSQRKSWTILCYEPERETLHRQNISTHTLTRL